MESIKRDTQSRTSLQGFLYSNQDPANRRDRDPTDFSYIDMAFAGQLAILEAQLEEIQDDRRAQIKVEHEKLLRSIELRKVRTRGYARLSAKVESDDLVWQPPLGNLLVIVSIPILLTSYFAMLYSGEGSAFPNEFIWALLAWAIWSGSKFLAFFDELEQY